MKILTFDIEEWFHILDNNSTKTESQWRNYGYRLNSNLDRILSLLDKCNQKATFFCLGWVAREHPYAIRKIHDSGNEIATHSDLHQLAYEQSKEDFSNDLRCSINAIEDIIGEKVISYRAPGFSVTSDNPWVFDVLIECGIKKDCSIFPARRAHGGFDGFGCATPAVISRNGCSIKEFPINLYELFGRHMIFSGGGYFRLIPYWMIRKMMRNSDYVMSYFHPRDFDVGQPIIEDLSILRKFKSYYGIKGAISKLEKLITEFDFIDLDKADKQIKWSEAKTIIL